MRRFICTLNVAIAFRDLGGIGFIDAIGDAFDYLKIDNEVETLRKEKFLEISPEIDHVIAPDGALTYGYSLPGSDQALFGDYTPRLSRKQSRFNELNKLAKTSSRKPQGFITYSKGGMEK